MQVLFYYPCIVADYEMNSWYKIKVYSLPLASGNHDNSKELTLYIPSISKRSYILLYAVGRNRNLSHETIIINRLQIGCTHLTHYLLLTSDDQPTNL